MRTFADGSAVQIFIRHSVRTRPANRNEGGKREATETVKSRKLRATQCGQNPPRGPQKRLGAYSQPCRCTGATNAFVRHQGKKQTSTNSCTVDEHRRSASARKRRPPGPLQHEPWHRRTRRSPPGRAPWTGRQARSAM